MRKIFEHHGRAVFFEAQDCVVYVRDMNRSYTTDYSTTNAVDVDLSPIQRVG